MMRKGSVEEAEGKRQLVAWVIDASAEVLRRSGVPTMSVEKQEAIVTRILDVMNEGSSDRDNILRTLDLLRVEDREEALIHFIFYSTLQLIAAKQAFRVEAERQAMNIFTQGFRA